MHFALRGRLWLYQLNTPSNSLSLTNICTTQVLQAPIKGLLLQSRELCSLSLEHLHCNRAIESQKPFLSLCVALSLQPLANNRPPFIKRIEHMLDLFLHQHREGDTATCRTPQLCHTGIHCAAND